MDTDQRVIDYIRDVAEYIPTRDGKISATMMLERFLFDSAMQYAPIAKLSGGEKRRLYLLKVLMEAPNVLLLDEPSNDLDIPTLTILEDYLDSFAGIVIAVSHDRYFINRTATRILNLTEQKIVNYIGNYDYYLEKKDALAEKYLNLFCRKTDTAKQYVQKWIPIVAASQSVKGKPEEKEFLLRWADVVDYE